MMGITGKILSSVLTTFYQAFFYSIILSVAVTLVYINYDSIRSAIKDWIKHFKNDKTFRCLFFLILYTVMILFRTLLNRNMWENPVSNVIGIWGLYDEKGVLTTQAIENFILFIPFSVMVIHFRCTKGIEVLKAPLRALWFCMKITFLFSAFIEFTQLFFRLGTFQLSDFFYNTAGGFVGGLIYYTYARIKDIVHALGKEPRNDR